MEVVSRVTPTLVKNEQCVKGKETVHRRTEIQKYLQQGKMNIKWLPNNSQ